MGYGLKASSCNPLSLKGVHVFGFNKHIRSNSKQYFYFAPWYEKGICTLSDLICDNLPNPVFKSFDDLIIEFDISYKDRIKYNTLFENVFTCGLLDDSSDQDFDIFNIFKIILYWLLRFLVIRIISGLRSFHLKSIKVFGKIFLLTLGIMWMLNGMRYNCNIKCTIETQLRSFFLKYFIKQLHLIPSFKN